MRPSPDLPASGRPSPFRAAASRLQGAASVLSARRCGAPVAASPAGPARAQASGSPGRSLPAVHTTGAAVATSPYLAGSRLLEISISVKVVSLASPGGCELCADGDSDSAGVAVTACTVRTQRGHGKAPGGASQTSQSPSSQLGNSSAAVAPRQQRPNGGVSDTRGRFRRVQLRAGQENGGAVSGWGGRRAELSQRGAVW